MNVRIGRLSWSISPGYSHCLKCLTTWNFVESHTTQYTPSEGCFPLCEKCWAGLTPEGRLPYYRELWLSWLGEDFGDAEYKTETAAKWPQIERAVLTEEQNGVSGFEIHPDDLHYRDRQRVANHEAAYDLLRRLRDWDVMQATGDGEYWRQQINAVLERAPVPFVAGMTLPTDALPDSGKRETRG